MPPRFSRLQRRSTNRRLTRRLLWLLATLISMSVTFLQLRFQSATTSAFDTHRLHFTAFFTVILIFAVLLEIGFKLEAAGSSCLATIVNTTSLFLGYLSLIPLLLIIEPYIGWMLLIVWFFLFVKWAWESYQESRNSTVSAVQEATNVLKILFNRNRNRNRNENGEEQV